MSNRTPSGRFLHIGEIWAFISIDEEGEGVCAMLNRGTWLPMVAADKARIDALMPYAQEVVDRTGVRVKLVKFSTREEIRTIEKKVPAQ